jgi:hypothetical protein
METIVILLGIIIIINIIKLIYFHIKFKQDSKYPCFVVVCQDGVMSKPLYYKEAKVYADKWYGEIFVDREEYNKLKQIKNEN